MKTQYVSVVSAAPKWSNKKNNNGWFADISGHTCSVCGSRSQSVSLRLFLEHELTAGFDAVVLLRCGNVTHRAGSPWQRSIPVWLRLCRPGHAQDLGQPLKEKLEWIIFYVYAHSKLMILSLKRIWLFETQVYRNWIKRSHSFGDVTFLVHSDMTCVLGVLKCRLRTTTQFNTTTVTSTMMNIKYLKDTQTHT